MKQAWHIFAKDARHFWPEIAVSVAVTAMFALLYPNVWIPRINGPDSWNVTTLAVVAMGLVPVSWWILITRVVQGENLVGDKQWWITKPYEWPQLLGAKALFVFAFIVLPLVCAQCILLAEAGFRPCGNLPGIAFDLLLVGSVLVVPLLAMATMTLSFGRMTLTVFGVLLAFVVYVALMAYGRLDRFSAPIADHVPGLLTLVLAGGAILMQYARRRVWISRLMLVALLLIGAGLGYVSHAPGLIAATYPELASGAALPLQLEVDPSSAVTAAPSSLPVHEEWVDVMIPMTVSGLAQDDAVTVDGVQVTAKAADGRQWTSQWEAEFGGHLRPGDRDETVDVRIDENFLKQVKREPLDLQLKFAVTQLRKSGEEQVAMAGHDFAVPGFGMCAPQPDFTTPWPTGITCRAPLRQPQMTYISVRWADDSCGAGGNAAQDGAVGAGWAGGVSTDPAEFNIASVWWSSIQLTNSVIMAWTGKPGRNPRRLLCPGSPMTFTRYAAVRRTQYGMAIANFHVPEWQTPVIRTGE